MPRTQSARSPLARIGALLAAFACLTSLSLASAQDEEPKPGLLTLIVTDEDGEPLFKATASLSPTKKERDEQKRLSSGAITLKTEHTDPDGIATLTIPPGEDRTVSIWSSSHSVNIDVKALEPGEEREVEVILKTKDDATFRGHVHGPDGAPIAGAVVAQDSSRFAFRSFGRGELVTTPRHPVAKTDEKGVFEISAATWRPSKVTVFAEGFAPRRMLVGGTHDNVNTEAPVDFELRPSSAIAVTIRGREDAVVVYAIGYSKSLYGSELSSNSSLGFASIRFRSEAGADGTQYLWDLPPDASVRLVAEVGRQTVYEVASFTTPGAGETVSLTWDLASDHTVSGVLVDEQGQPIAGLSIWLKGDGESSSGQFSIIDKPQAQQVTGADGRFSFAGVSAAIYRVGLGYEHRSRDRSDLIASVLLADATGAGDPPAVKLVGVRGLFIRGRLVDAEGEPTAGYVMAYCAETRHSADSSMVPADGKFEIGPLLRADYKVTGLSFLAEFMATSEPTVHPAGTEDVVVQYRLGGTVRLTAMDAETRSPMAATISLTRIDTGGVAIQRAKEDGAIYFKGQLPGTYVASASAAGDLVGQSEEFEIVAGTSLDNLVIELSRGTRVRVECMEYAGPLNITVRTSAGFWTVESLSAPGQVEIAVPVGEVTLEIQAPRTSEKVTHTLDAKAGEVATWKASIPPASGDDQGQRETRR